MKKIVVTGPESTGKTTLCIRLAKYLNVPYVEEYAVRYLTATGGKYTYKDLLRIAKGQIAIEDKIINDTKTGLILSDTDLITVKIWSKFKFQKVSRWIMHTIRHRHYDHYLLCFPDIPWEYDPFRENPNDRALLFDLYEKELKKYGKDYTIIKGTQDERFHTSLNAIEKVISL